MGQAKRRGDYEKRKAEAITAGRVKPRRVDRHVLLSGPALFAGLLSIVSGTRTKKAVSKKRKRTVAVDVEPLGAPNGPN